MIRTAPRFRTMSLYFQEKEAVNSFAFYPHTPNGGFILRVKIVFFQSFYRAHSTKIYLRLSP